MMLTRKSVELLAPAGTWDGVTAAVEAGADAIYLGGKLFNMRRLNADKNFDDELLKKAVDYAHAHDVKIYVTINNMMNEQELEPLRGYLQFLAADIKPDALLVQDLAVIELVKELKIDIPLHASVTMNIHNEAAIKKLQEYGFTRIVSSREVTLAEVSLFKERTGIEVEYFMQGDMCMSESGQCMHSGVVFGASGSRGCCLKSCRWSYQLVDEAGEGLVDPSDPGSLKLSLKDMCMYRNLPELIQSGVHSFKIEGRQRPAAVIRRIVEIYRKAIDRYIADPTGYSIDEADWQDLYDHRFRDFSTAFAFGQAGKESIGFSSTVEQPVFSQPIKEAGLQFDMLDKEMPIRAENPAQGRLAVRVADLAGAEAACQNGADAIYIGGEAFRPVRPWTLADIRKAMAIAAAAKTKVVIETPRTTMHRECGELEQFLQALNEIKPDGIMVGNLGSLNLASGLTDLPIQADFTFNTCNHLNTQFLKNNGAAMATASLEASYAYIRDLVESSELPVEIIVHGATEAMICHQNFSAMQLDFNPLVNPQLCDRHYALLDAAGEAHPLRLDQYGRTHILFAKDLCLLPFLEKLNGVASYRIEAQHYSAELTARLTKLYRTELDKIAAAGSYRFDPAVLAPIQKISPRELGIGVYRYRICR